MKKSVSGQMAFGAVKGAAEGAASGWLESKATGAKSQKETKKNMLSGAIGGAVGGMFAPMINYSLAPKKMRSVFAGGIGILGLYTAVNEIDEKNTMNMLDIIVTGGQSYLGQGIDNISEIGGLSWPAKGMIELTKFSINFSTAVSTNAFKEVFGL